MNSKKEFGSRVKPFYQLGEATFRFLQKVSFIEKYFHNTEEQLKIIYPQNKSSESLYVYMSCKFMKLYEFLFVGVLLIVVYCINFSSDNQITNILRQNYWGEDETHTVTALIDGKTHTIDFDVSHQELPKETMRLIMEEQAKDLEKYILGENTSVNCVTTSLDLISQIPDTQIDVFWELEENDVLKWDGTVVTDNIPQEGMIISLKALLSYEDIQIETEFFINLVKPVVNKEQKNRLSLIKEIENVNSKTVSQESLVLPTKVNGKEIKYLQENESTNKWIFPVMFVICVPLLFFSQDEKLEKRRRKRENQMLIDYPEIVNKLILYMGAGLTVQSAFEMISKNYLREKNSKMNYQRYAYEEIVFLCHSVHGGMSFTDSMENFSVRCGTQSFRKLSMMLLQNLKKGSNELVGLLRQESINAFEARKNTARKLGEEAGTKLLLPMILSLGVVLVVLIVPAWMSFQL